MPAVNLFPNGNLSQDIKSLADMLLQEDVTESDAGVTFAPNKSEMPCSKVIKST